LLGCVLGLWPLAVCAESHLEIDGRVFKEAKSFVHMDLSCDNAQAWVAFFPSQGDYVLRAQAQQWGPEALVFYFPRYYFSEAGAIALVAEEWQGAKLDVYREINLLIDSQGARFRIKNHPGDNPAFEKIGCGQ